MPGRTRDDMLAALRQSRARRAAELDRLLDWEDPGHCVMRIARLDELDRHIDGLLADYLTLGPPEETP